MLIDYKGFFLNAFIIFFPVFLYPFLYQRFHHVMYNRIVLFVLFTVAMLLAMSFPIKHNDIIFDFRGVCLTAGSLYGGLHVSMLLYGVLILYRDLLDVPNQMAYIASLLPTFVFAYIAIKRYPRLPLPQKMLTGYVLFLLIRISSLVTFLILTGGSAELFKLRFLSTLAIIFVQAAICSCFIYVFERIRNNMNIQQELINREKIKIVSDIAASVAHEIRNPLTSVRGFIQLLGESNLNEDKRVFYQQICLEELDRAQLIISDYLTLAKPDPELEETIDVNNEIHYITNILMSYANYQNVQIQSTLPEETLWIIGDKYKFRQALINIGKNAIESMKDGGTLSVDASEQQKSVVISFADTGVGMTAEQIARLGTPYYSTKEKGTGLGTMVSFSIIKKMRGTIRIQSKVGKGTKCLLSFPSELAPASIIRNAESEADKASNQ